MPITHYETLGVDRGASKPEIAAAFRAQMRALHSDAGGDDELAKRVSAAYNVLSHPTKRAAYDRTLVAESQQPPPPPGSSPPMGGRPRRVFDPQRAADGDSMLHADPSGWSWHTTATTADQSITDAPGKGRRARTIGLVLAFVAWVAAGAAAAPTVGLPLARIEAMSVPVALACGVGLHLFWSALLVTHAAFRRWGLLLALAAAAFAAIVIYLDVGTPLPMIGSLLCMGASMLTTFFSFGMLLAGTGDRSSHEIIDGSFISQVGAVSMGDRSPAIDQLLAGLTAAFRHRVGVRVILLPDRVAKRPSISPVRSQVAVVIGRTVHLIAIPPLGAAGLEISGSDVISDAQVHRNVVRDEVTALSSRFGRSGSVRGYVVPTRMGAVPAQPVDSHGILFRSLDQVIDAIGTAAGRDLDAPAPSFRHRALEAMALLL